MKDGIDKDLTHMVAMLIEMDDDKLWENRDKHLFEELGLDSLLALEIIGNVELKYKIEVSEDRLEEIVTLSRAIQLVKNLIAEQRPRTEA